MKKVQERVQKMSEMVRYLPGIARNCLFTETSRHFFNGVHDALIGRESGLKNVISSHNSGESAYI